MIKNNYSIILMIISLLFGEDSTSNSISTIDTLNISITDSLDSIEVHSDTSLVVKNTLFDAQIEEAKILLSDAVISDITGDTLSVLFNFKIFKEYVERKIQMGRRVLCF